jgi:hypothetical protein
MSALAIENQNILVINIVDSWHITLAPCDDDVICSSVKYMHIFYPIVSMPSGRWDTERLEMFQLS